MPPVGRRGHAITAVAMTVVGIRPAVIKTCTDDQGFSTRIRNAMGPGVVRAEGDAARCAALNGKHQAVVAGGSTGVDFRHEPVILSDRRILQVETASLILVGCCGACAVTDPIDGAGTQSQKDSRIVLLRVPQVDGVAAEIAGRY